MSTRVIPSAYHHVQATAASTWTITHNLGGSGTDGTPIVDVLVNDGGNLVKMLPADVEYTNKNTVVITFTTPQSGRATIIV
jgi:hypothetical protein